MDDLDLFEDLRKVCQIFNEAKDNFYQLREFLSDYNGPGRNEMIKIFIESVETLSEESNNYYLALIEYHKDHPELKKEPKQKSIPKCLR